MKDKDEREILIEEIHRTIDRILANNQIAEEEKIQAFLKALQIIESGKGEE